MGIIEVYSNLKERNSLGLKVHLLSKETGDAAEVIAGLGPRGQFEGGYQNLTEWAGETVHVKESHHFYPVLFYFRFREPFYSVSRTALVSLDTISLIKSALDDQEYSWLKESAAVDDLWSGTMLELRTLANNLLNDKEDLNAPPDEERRARWEQRYKEGVERLEKSGIKTTDTGMEEYVSLRTQWDRYITSLAPKFAYDMDEIDTVLAKIK